jgi:hypothetical protein
MTAGGEILHFAEDDDLVPEGLYAAALAEFRRFPNIGLVFGSTEAFGEPSKTLIDEQALFARAARGSARHRMGNSRGTCRGLRNSHNSAQYLAPQSISP